MDNKEKKNFFTEKFIKKSFWLQRIGKGKKDNSDYLNPIFCWCMIGLTLFLCFGVGLAVVLPLAV